MAGVVPPPTATTAPGDCDWVELAHSAMARTATTGSLNMRRILAQSPAATPHFPRS
jgi:hypothetical protein